MERGCISPPLPVASLFGVLCFLAAQFGPATSFFVGQTDPDVIFG